jgi:hypothetical protein
MYLNIKAIYLTRVEGLLSSPSRTTSLSCQCPSCPAILLQGLALISPAVRALRGMITEFLFFMGIAAICFSGLLYTLWTLGLFT